MTHVAAARIVMQFMSNRSEWWVQLHLVNDKQAHSGSHTDITTLASDDIPLLRCGHNHLSLSQLFLAQLRVSRQLCHLQACTIIIVVIIQNIGP